jgi:hypothetical protein
MVIAERDCSGSRRLCADRIAPAGLICATIGEMDYRVITVTTGHGHH